VLRRSAKTPRRRLFAGWFRLLFRRGKNIDGAVAGVA
jgi:hypothetical protein